MRTPTGPRRTCVGCRSVRPAATLLRLRRRSDGVVVPDVAHRREGRSAWVCPTSSCLATAVRRRAFHRALTGSSKLVIRDPELATLRASLVADVDARVALLRRTSASSSAGLALSSLAALQASLHAAGEVA
jgi:uncharacterized protein